MSPPMPGLPSVTVAGVERLLACRPSKPDKTAKRFGAGQKVSRSKWSHRDFREHCSNPPAVLDQGTTPACVGFASCTAFTWYWRVVGGDSGLEFSPFWVYDHIAHDD